MPPINPFTPEFGSVPLVMAGRQSIRRELFDAFVQGRGNPNLSSILVGPRGSGKTALLTYLGKEASEQGWIAVHAVAIPGMLEDIYEQTLLACDNVLGEGKAKSLRLASIGVGPVSASWEVASAPSENWRTRMGKLVSAIEDAGYGLLITVDEVVATLDEMVTLAAVYQLFVREQRRVALVMAGLPHNISALINDKSVSFLRRAQQHTLGTIPDADVREAFRQTAAKAEKTSQTTRSRRASTQSGAFPTCSSSWGSDAGRQPARTTSYLRAVRSAEFEMRRMTFGRASLRLHSGSSPRLTCGSSRQCSRTSARAAFQI